VVVVGYGTQKRKELTGSVATINKQALSQISTSFENLLGGGDRQQKIQVNTQDMKNIKNPSILPQK
jgi:hypothetical protein